MARKDLLTNADKVQLFLQFFPSQDYLPKGGFGNLIALPLQKAAREKGNCSFSINSLFNRRRV